MQWIKGLNQEGRVVFVNLDNVSTIVPRGDVVAFWMNLRFMAELHDITPVSQGVLMSALRYGVEEA